MEAKELEQDALEETALDKAVNLAGGQTALGDLIGKRQSTIRTWMLNKGKVPAEEAGKIEEALGGKVTKKQLRPDVF